MADAWIESNAPLFEVCFLLLFFSFFLFFFEKCGNFCGQVRIETCHLRCGGCIEAFEESNFVWPARGRILGLKRLCEKATANVGRRGT